MIAIRSGCSTKSERAFPFNDALIQNHVFSFAHTLRPMRFTEFNNSKLIVRTSLGSCIECIGGPGTYTRRLKNLNKCTAVERKNGVSALGESSCTLLYTLYYGQKYNILILSLAFHPLLHRLYVRHRGAQHIIIVSSGNFAYTRLHALRHIT